MSLGIFTSSARNCVSAQNRDRRIRRHAADDKERRIIAAWLAAGAATRRL
ncbi:MAG: hypothetical protein ACJ8FA_01895 [Xanthobacteraceae bacterium]